MVLAFPRYGSVIGLEHLIWITPVPLFIALRGIGLGRGLLLGWLAGLTLESAGFSWILLAIRTFTSFGAVLASFLFVAWLWLACVPWALLGGALGSLRRPAAIFWILPFWVAVEHYFPRLFPWHVGGALWASPLLVQTVDLFGASGLTALVFLVAAVLYLAFESLRGRARAPWISGGVALFLLIGALVYGSYRKTELARMIADRPRLRVGILQGAIDPRVDSAPGDELRWYLDRTEELIAREPGLDLIVWPEGIRFPERFLLDAPGLSPFLLLESAARKDPELARLLVRLRALRVPLLAGAAGVGVERAGGELVVTDFYNIALYLRPGEASPSVYRKNWRMPFGENVSWIPEWIRTRFGLTHIGGLTAGKDNPVFELGDYRFRNLICYEAVLPYYVRPSARSVDFLVNVTEDIWYGDTSHVPQHLSVLVLRSIESRVPIVRATNVGPSGVVGVLGEFRGPGTVFQSAAFVGEFVPCDVSSLYDLGGWLFPAAAALVAIGGAISGAVRRSRAPGPTPPDASRGPKSPA